MKCMKTLGCGLVVGMVMMALLGSSSASATTIDNEGVPLKVGSALGISFTASAAFRTTSGATIATCTGGNVSGTITNEGGSGKAVEGSIGTLNWTGCNTTFDTLANGTLSVTNIAGTSNGTLRSTGAKVTANFLGVSCVLETNNTDLGTVTEGKPGQVDYSGVLPGVSGGLCPASWVLAGTAVWTNPTGTLAVTP